MNALSPYSALIVPAAAGRTAASAGLAASVETTPPEGFAGWLPTAPSTAASSSAAGTMMTNMPIALDASDLMPSGPVAATPGDPSSTDTPVAIVANILTPPAPKPVGSAEGVDLRLPMTSIAPSAGTGMAMRSFVPSMPSASSTEAVAVATAGVQPLIPSATDARATVKGPSNVMPEPTKAASTTQATDLVASAAVPTAIVEEAATGAGDPTATPQTNTARKARTAKAAEDASADAAPPLPAAATLPPAVAAVPPAATTAPQSGGDAPDGEKGDQIARAPAGGTGATAPAGLPSGAVTGAKAQPAAANPDSGAATNRTTSTKESRSADKAKANAATTSDHATGEARATASGQPAAHLAPSFRAQVDALQQPTKPEPAPAPTPIAQASQIGHDTAVAIARHVASDGGEALTIRIAPAELGRIEVRLTFDDGGTLRATVAADQPASLDLLRRDTDSLVRALGDAGVRTDTDSVRYDTRSSDGGSAGGFASSGQSGQGGQGRRAPLPARYAAMVAGDEPDADIRTSSPRGRVDLMA